MGGEYEMLDEDEYRAMVSRPRTRLTYRRFFETLADAGASYYRKGQEPIAEGEEVEGDYKNRGRWYVGKITKRHRDGSYDIVYPILHKERDKKRSQIREIISEDVSKESSKKLEAGDRVECDYKSKGKWFPGKIERVNSDGTFNVKYDDGDAERWKKASEVRGLGGGLGRVGGGGVDKKLEAGDRVECDYKSKGRWYPGKISYIHRDGTYDIRYHELRKERKKSPKELRRVGCAEPSSNSKFEEGDTVEGNLKGKGEWRKGKLERINKTPAGATTVDITYIDGENETAKPLNEIRHVQVEGTAPEASEPSAVGGVAEVGAGAGAGDGGDLDDEDADWLK